MARSNPGKKVPAAKAAQKPWEAAGYSYKEWIRLPMNRRLAITRGNVNTEKVWERAGYTWQQWIRLPMDQRAAITAEYRHDRAGGKTSSWFWQVMIEDLYDLPSAEAQHLLDTDENIYSTLQREDPRYYLLSMEATIERKMNEKKKWKNRPGGALARWLEYEGRRSPEMSARGIPVGETP